MRLLSSIFQGFRRGLQQKRIRAQFIGQGYTQIEHPPIGELLPPLRFPEIIDVANISLFQKDDMQMLVIPTLFLPRSRLPHIGRTFVLLCTPLGDSPLTQNVSAALRDPAEQFSLVDQLVLDSYPAISPLPHSIIFAADDRSARAFLQVVGINKNQSGSLILHAGRLLAQISA